MDLSVYPFQFIDKSILSLDSRPSQPKPTPLSVQLRPLGRAGRRIRCDM